MSEILREQISLFGAGQDVEGPAAEMFLDALIDETDEGLLANLFHAWHSKGIGEDEIYSIAGIMRDRCMKVSSRHETFVDIVGTGGSKAKTFNVSTAAAFVTAGSGLPVAKHGNKAATSSSGSADVLAELGVDPAVDPATAERCLNEVGICFMFAPNFHRLSPTLAKVRRGLGFPTIFNCVGPLCNPAGAPHQLIGVWNEDLVRKMASALARLGTKRSWVVHGRDGLDEITLSTSTYVAEVANGSFTTFDITPGDFGVSTEAVGWDLRVDPASSATLILDVLADRSGNRAAVSIVELNAAAAIAVATGHTDLKSSLHQANESIRTRSGLNKLEQLRKITNDTADSRA